MARTKDALKILKGVTGNHESIKAGIAQAKINFEVAQMIYDARTKAGLSQSELADLIGSRQPVIARFEGADYEGHSLTMLQRIAAALGQRLELRFVPCASKPPLAQLATFSAANEGAESTRCSLFTSATDNITTQRRSVAILAPKSPQI